MTVSFQNGSFLGGSASAGTYTVNGGVTAASLYNTDALDKRYDYQDTKEGYEIGYAGKDAALNTKISNVCTYLKQGKEDRAIEAYQALLDEISTQERYAVIAQNESQLKAIAKELIQSNLEDGQTLEDYIRANTANNFQRGFEINWDGDKATEEDVLKTMCDLDETTRFEGLERAGGKVCKAGVGAAGGAAAGAAIGAIFGGIGAVPGAIVGGIIGFVGGLFV